MHNQNYALCFLILTCLAAIPCVASGAAVKNGDVIDQDFVLDVVPIGYTILPALSQAQTFTVGVTGYLSGIDLQVFRNYDKAIRPLEIKILRTHQDGSPDQQSVIAELSLTFDEIPAIVLAGPSTKLPTQLTRVELATQRFHVEVDDVLAIMLSTEDTNPSSSRYAWGAGDDRPRRISIPKYSGGQGYVRELRLSEQFLLKERDVDFGFRTVITVVPEPASVALILSACLCGVGVRRRRLA